MRRAAKVGFALALIWVGQAAQAAPRIALVIGNSRYELKGACLPLAANDATAIAEALHDVGFDVDVPLIDGTQDQMNKAIQRFQKRLEANPSAEAVVFYAGHGAQYGGLNYLIPTDMKKVNESLFKDAAVPVEAIYDAFRYGEPQFAMVILDACRDNPYGASRKGLVEPREPDAVVRLGMPKGTITAFATDFGDTARDSSDGEHSPYTKALLQFLGEPGLTLTDFFIRVRLAVESDSDGHQSPKENTGQKAPFLFRDPAFLRVTINGDIDDDLMVTAGSESYVQSLDGRSKQLRLLPGDNVVTVMVVNFRSPNSQARREGWHYNATMTGVGGPAEITFSAAEDEPPMRRWGKTFIVARALVHVESPSGRIHVDDQEPVVWEDGFSLLGVEPSNRLYEAIRWAVIDAGVGLVTDPEQPPVRARTVPEIIRDVREVHRKSLTHTKPALHREPDAIAHKAHARAVELLDAADEQALAMIVDRVKRESRDELAANIRHMLGDPDQGFAAAMRAIVAGRHYAELRFYYSRQLASDDRARHLMGTASNEELAEILTRLGKG